MICDEIYLGYDISIIIPCLAKLGAKYSYQVYQLHINHVDGFAERQIKEQYSHRKHLAILFFSKKAAAKNQEIPPAICIVFVIGKYVILSPCACGPF